LELVVNAHVEFLVLMGFAVTLCLAALTAMIKSNKTLTMPSAPQRCRFWCMC
jgi:hypothetical protein